MQTELENEGHYSGNSFKKSNKCYEKLRKKSYYP